MCKPLSSQDSPKKPAPPEPNTPQPVAEKPPPELDSARCPICFALMFGAQCKLICPNCGYREDCSDLFPPVA